MSEDLTPQQANVVILIYLISILKRANFEPDDLVNPQNSKALIEARNRQLNTLQANLNYAEKMAK